jgi:hypothetical protein
MRFGVTLLSIATPPPEPIVAGKYGPLLVKFSCPSTMFAVYSPSLESQAGERDVSTQRALREPAPSFAGKPSLSVVEEFPFAVQRIALRENDPLANPGRGPAIKMTMAIQRLATNRTTDRIAPPLNLSMGLASFIP